MVLLRVMELGLWLGIGLRLGLGVRVRGRVCGRYTCICIDKL